MSKLNLQTLLVISIVCVSAPIYFIQFHFGITIYYVLQLLLLGTVIFLMLIDMGDSKFQISKTLILIFLISTLLYFLVMFNHELRQISSEMFRMFVGYIAKFIVILYAYNIYIKNHILLASYLIYIGLFAVLSSSLIFFMLITNVWPLGYEFVQINEKKYMYDFYFAFSSSVRNLSDGLVVPRMQSFFDEPGAYAFYIASCIMLNDIFIKNKSFNFIFFFGGFLSFTLSFYVFSLLYLFMHYVFPGSKKRAISFNLQNMIILLFGSLTAYYLYSEFISFRYMVDALILRFEINPETGSIRGDNRFYNSILPTSIMFGDGLVGNRDSVVKEIFNIGIVGLFASYLPLLITFLRSMKLRQKDIFIASSLFFALLVQRPVIDKMFIFLFCFLLLFRTLDVKKI